MIYNENKLNYELCNYKKQNNVDTQYIKYYSKHNNINIESNNQIWYGTYYEKLLHQPEWYNYREQVLKQHNYTCDWCGTHNQLQVHHKVYYKDPRTNYLINPWEYSEDKVMCLCDSCHKKYHQKYQVKTYYIKYNK